MKLFVIAKIGIIMNSKVKMRLLLTVSMVAGAFVSAAPSQAYESRQAYSACIQDWGSSYSFFSGGNDLPANTLILSCPMTDTTTLSHPSMTAVNFHYDDNNNAQNVVAFRCVSFYNSAGGMCGDAVYSGGSFTGTSGFSVPNSPASFATQWNNGAHFATIGVYLPPKTAGGVKSYAKGYYMAN
jgi:hypothetical protein